MAEHAVTYVASAVAGELISRVLSGLIQRYGNAITSEKLQRLEMLLIKINSVIEVSEKPQKRTIESSSLLQWRDKLNEAALQGIEVLASFTQRVKDAEETSNANGDKQQGEEASSSTVAPTADIGPRNSLSTMLLGICNARKILLSGVDDDMERLNRTLGNLEQLSPDIGEFIRLLHLEALPKEDQTPCTSLSTKVHGPPVKVRETRGSKRPKILDNKRYGGYCSYEYNGDKPALLSNLECGSALLRKEQQVKLLQDRLGAAFAEICKAVDLADSSDFKDLEWLEYWAGILREAKEQGRDVLGSTCAHKIVNTENKEEPSVESDQEEDELGTFVHRLEALARDVEYFRKLVYLCPTR